MGLIPDIKIKITGTEINAVLEALAQISPIALTPHEKTTLSVLEIVSEKLWKKKIAKRHDINPFKLILKYYEAYYLKIYLLQYNGVMNAYYVQTIIDKLDQKLA